MAKVDTYQCDGCGAQKGNLNHWFRLGVQDVSLGIYTWAGGDATDDDKHFCSDECVIKAVQQWLSARKEGTHA